ASASTLTITMCLPCLMALKAWRMPAAGTPVASTTTSISGQAISASASSVTCVVPRASAFPSEDAEIASSFQPAVRSWRRARETAGSAARNEMHAVRQPHMGDKHGAELARPDQADGDRTERSLPFEQHGVEVHGTLRANSIQSLLQTNRELSSEFAAVRQA